ncbi:hypothetical protein DFH08DRAFT_802270 [Mycena albidolilacea]|uniref:F-box domain-containing protein n=1 Tax=Mycena albidolilacea TaxID=1033008 RepID=A0AAD7AIA5_9AGAR|nr:hypothetical protein DFH08DRAFT_802270 [Mycena albidolilacea]
MSVQLGELEEEPVHVVLRFRVGFEGEEAARGSVISIPGYIISVRSWSLSAVAATVMAWQAICSVLFKLYGLWLSYGPPIGSDDTHPLASVNVRGTGPESPTQTLIKILKTLPSVYLSDISLVSHLFRDLTAPVRFSTFYLRPGVHIELSTSGTSLRQQLDCLAFWFSDSMAPFIREGFISLYYTSLNWSLRHPTCHWVLQSLKQFPGSKPTLFIVQYIVPPIGGAGRSRVAGLAHLQKLEINGGKPSSSTDPAVPLLKIPHFSYGANARLACPLPRSLRAECLPQRLVSCGRDISCAAGAHLESYRGPAALLPLVPAGSAPEALTVTQGSAANALEALRAAMRPHFVTSLSKGVWLYSRIIRHGALLEHIPAQNVATTTPVLFNRGTKPLWVSTILTGTTKSDAPDLRNDCEPAQVWTLRAQWGVPGPVPPKLFMCLAPFSLRRSISTFFSHSARSPL